MKTATMLAVLTMTLVSASPAQAQFNRLFKDPLKVIRKTAKDPLKAVRGTTDAVAGKGTAKRIAGPLFSKRIPRPPTLSPIRSQKWDIDADGWVIYGYEDRYGRVSKAANPGGVQKSHRAQVTYVGNHAYYESLVPFTPRNDPKTMRRRVPHLDRPSNPPTPQLAINPNTGLVYNVQTGQNVARAQRQVQFDQYGRQVVWYRYGNLQQKATPQPINNGGGNNGRGNNGGFNNGGFNNGGFNNGGFNNGGFNNGGFNNGGFNNGGGNNGGGNNGGGNNGRGNANGNNLSTGEQLAVGILGALLQASQNNR